MYITKKIYIITRFCEFQYETKVFCSKYYKKGKDPEPNVVR